MLRFQVASDIDHDHVVCEVSHGRDFLCLLSQEDGDTQVMVELPIELPTTGKASFRRIPLADFLVTIERARKQLVDPDPA